MSCGHGPLRKIFRDNRLFFMLFAYFVYIAHLTKFTIGSSLLMEKSLKPKFVRHKVKYEVSFYLYKY